MESYGEKLRLAREAKKISIEVVQREATITKQYIEALEEENEDVFPAPAYLVGFLKRYAEYLGEDSEELLKLYNSKVLQESPVPPQLLAKTKPKFLVPLITIFSILFFAGICCFLYFYVFNIPERREQRAKELAESLVSHKYTFDGTTQDVRLYVGDQILVPPASGTGVVVLSVENTLGSLALLTPAGTQVIDLSEEVVLDVDGDNIAEIILYVSDISSTDASRGAEVRMLLKDAEVLASEGIVATVPLTGQNLETIPVEDVTKNNSRLIVHEDTRAYPFTVNISFRGSCLFRYRSDNKDSVENFYHSGEVISVSSNNRFRLWASNINTLKIQVIAGFSTNDLEVGKAGAVVAEDIKWIRDPKNGMYRIVVDELD